MFVHQRTQGIVLKKVDRGPTDQLFAIYTKDFGKIEVLGRGIRKINSKLRAGIDIFYLSEIEFIQGKRYKTLTNAILIDKFSSLRGSLPRLNAVHEISDLLNSLIYYDKPEQAIWNLLNEVFYELNSKKFDDKKLKLIYYYFFWKLFCSLGYKPQLYNCTICLNKLYPDNIRFSSKLGGVICKNCFAGDVSGIIVDAETVKILRILLDKDWQAASRIKIKEEYLASLPSTAKHYMSFYSNSIKKD